MHLIYITAEHTHVEHTSALLGKCQLALTFKELNYMQLYMF